ncbi:MAG: YcjF family protein [Desulfovibrionaceae bacterium]
MSATKKSDVKNENEAAEVVSPEIVASEPAVNPCEVDSLIRKRVYWAVGLGLAPVPLVDLAGLVALQMELVHALAKKYGVPYRADLAKTIIGSLLGSVVPVAAAPALASLAKFIPFIGLSTSAVSMSLTGGACTYAIGRIFAKHFASGGNLLDVDTEKMREGFKSSYQKGKDYVAKLRKKEAAEPAAAAETAEQPSA